MIQQPLPLLLFSNSIGKGCSVLLVFSADEPFLTYNIKENGYIICEG
ncbi:hypothetical protein IDJ77_06140 [Mucilaginibacter sp. ZT4R22]|uniref:Uncharacterized protein n=1 Tax=Mucilaginibacter pankratovii TaxID=2772110 RepID=A0ABR7WM28_9SPHI|nr:hypothetical protein [Mucilaginibacter pankratovii]MBD1363384.1 hypothetical protein [Mucilaginibacter pankratovii]